MTNSIEASFYHFFSLSRRCRDDGNLDHLLISWRPKDITVVPNIKFRFGDEGQVISTTKFTQ